MVKTTEYHDWGLGKDGKEPLRKTEAEYTSRCPACDDEILPGDIIVMEDDEWIHKECAD